MGEENDKNGRPPFDADRAASFVGKYVLVFLEYYDHEENFIEKKQVHGTIVSADGHKGFVIKLHGKSEGEYFYLPPDLRPFRDASPGEYRLHSTNEIVRDPDLLCYWDITLPPPKDSETSQQDTTDKPKSNS
jgi:hypothetical protein